MKPGRGGRFVEGRPQSKTLLMLSVTMVGFLGARGAVAAPASIDAASAEDLVAVVRGFYVPYMAGDDRPEPPAATDVISAHATPHLKGLIAADAACEKRSEGECSLDFDVIIDGQDWTLKGAPVLSVKADDAGHAVVVARFVNDGTATEVDYDFVRAAGGWLIGDVEGHDAESGGWRLTALIAKEPG